MIGKIPPELLMRYVFSRIGVKDPDVVVGPAIGEDSAVIDLGSGRVLVAHVDPITGAVELLGWLAVHISCNDVAVRGVKPRWLLPVLYLPEGSGEDLLDTITKQIDEAAKEVEVMIVGGHTEYTLGIPRPLISMTAIGVGEKGKYVTTAGAKAGDAVIMTKTVAVEGTAILATDFRDILVKKGIPDNVIDSARKFLRRVSVVKEALALAEEGLATSMHDPTEGGLVGGLAEIAYASGKTIHIYEDRIRIAKETMIIVGALGLDPLRLISSGTLVATVPRDKVERALKVLEDAGIEASVIGYVEDRGDSYVVIHRGSGYVEGIKDVHVRDELNRAWDLWGSQLNAGKRLP